MNESAAPDSRTQSPLLNAALFATALTSVATFVLFGMIHRFTHHRPLGAATLSVMIVGVFFAFFAASARLHIGRTVARAALGVAALAIVVFTFVG